MLRGIERVSPDLTSLGQVLVQDCKVDDGWVSKSGAIHGVGHGGNGMELNASDDSF